MSPYEVIRLEGALLANNQTVRMRCPWCQGGGSLEQTFVVTRVQGTLKYHCFRASCTGKSGMLGADSRATSMAAAKKPAVKFDWDTFPLTDETLKYLGEAFYMTADVCRVYGIKQTRAGDIVVPTYSRLGTPNGHIVRLRNPRRNKVLTFLSDTQPKLAYWTAETDEHPDTVVIVEDVFSAMRTSEFVEAVALLGTSMNVEQALDIAANKYRRVILMLDQDASATAARMFATHRSRIPGLEVRRLLDKDVKNMTPAEADKWFNKVLEQTK